MTKKTLLSTCIRSALPRMTAVDLRRVCKTVQRHWDEEVMLLPEELLVNSGYWEFGQTTYGARSVLDMIGAGVDCNEGKSGARDWEYLFVLFECEPEILSLSNEGRYVVIEEFGDRIATVITVTAWKRFLEWWPSYSERRTEGYLQGLRKETERLGSWIETVRATDEVLRRVK